MNTYKAFYSGKTTEINAESAYDATKKAIEFFKPPKSKQYMVHVALLKVGDREIVINTASL